MQNEQTPAAGPSLLPCPFCGGEAWLNDYEAKYSDLPPQSRAPQCRSCGASLGYLTTPAKAIAAWNRRPPVPSPPSLSSVVQGDASGVERGESAGDMLSRLGMDGKLWAEEFQKTALTLGYPEMDDGWLLGWFCNAIMAGYDHARRKYDPEILAHFRPQPSGETREAVAAIAAERQRQVDAEGWSEAHDDEHPTGQLARAAGCYALSAGRDGSDDGFFDCVVDAAIHHSWPWDRSWWKPKDRRSDLVRAGALIVAEIERLDRLALIRPAPVASSDQPEQGGGMEVVEDSAFKIASDLHAAYEQLIYGLPKYLEAENLTDEENMIREAYITLDVTAHRLAAITPAEPAEARVRELTERVEYLRKSRDGHAAASHAEFEKRVAAEAQLAKAKEALERIVHMRVELTGTPVDTEAANAWALTLDAAADIARQTLAALQQAGEVG